MSLSPILLPLALFIMGVVSIPPHNFIPLASHTPYSNLGSFHSDYASAKLSQPSLPKSNLHDQVLAALPADTGSFPQSHPPPPPLYITPLIQSGQYLLAQQLSRVSSLIPEVPEGGYSGFITIDAKAGTHLHFWFIPKNCEHWRQEPTALWLQGGHGLSTIRGALQENLALFNVTEEGSVGRFNFGLNRYMNILMVDNTRVGFSHTHDPNYIVTSYEFIAEELYSVLAQFFLFIPELKRSIYIGGTSAGASKVTTLTELILNRDPRVVQVAGVILGDGLTEIETDFSLLGEYLYNLGMIERKVVRNVTNILDDGHALAKTGDRPKAEEEVYFGKYLDELNRHIGYKGQELQDVMRAFRFHDHWLDFVEQEETRDKLHVGRLPFVLIDPKANGFLKGGSGINNGEKLELILNRKVPVMRFQGQYDGLISYQSSIMTMRNLNWYGQACLQSDQFRRSQIWIDGQLFGYLRKCLHLWEVLVLRAAHVVQLTAAKPLWTLVWKFVRDTEHNKLTEPQS